MAENVRPEGEIVIDTLVGDSAGEEGLEVREGEGVGVGVVGVGLETDMRVGIGEKSQSENTKVSRSRRDLARKSQSRGFSLA